MSKPELHRRIAVIRHETEEPSVESESIIADQLARITSEHGEEQAKQIAAQFSVPYRAVL